MNSVRSAVVVVIVAAFAATPVAGVQRLEPYNIDNAAISVSGISSGGYMAHQLHVAHSARLMGVGVMAAGPYFCAGGGYPWNLWRAFDVCMDLTDMVPFSGPPDVATSVAATYGEAHAGRIDDPSHISGDRVYLFSGTQDQTVPRAVMDTLHAYYRTFVIPSDIRYETNVAAGHGLATRDAGNPSCGVTQPPYVNDCDYDTAGELLAHIYGPLNPPVPAAGDRLLEFDQEEFASATGTIGLAATGFAYVPADCAAGKRCRLHIALHGCRQNAESVGDAFYNGAGFNRWAESNNILVLYPQATRVTSVLWPWPNPRGCWDWWGFSGADYHVRSGPQIRTLRSMIGRLTGV